MEIDGVQRLAHALRETSAALWAAPGWLRGATGAPQWPATGDPGTLGGAADGIGSPSGAADGIGSPSGAADGIGSPSGAADGIGSPSGVTGGPGSPSGATRGPERLGGATGDPVVDGALRRLDAGWSDGRVRAQDGCASLGALADQALRRSGR